ncbi:hypothetical protein B0H16DRAFT_1447779 [Mycena metata]|uniref:Uncharacterized protein n=1 Tax=Mycena metata TaxID=1033252 RepID=A0AAD7KBR7_9AGAR|nr:hypothetical protein B0H16DRAFT_1447779 [Mycena metata]
MECADSAMVARWDAHFKFFAGVQDVELNFSAIRAAVITIRLRYNALPFTFTHSLYRDDLQKDILALRIEESRNGGGVHGAPQGAFYGPYGGYGGYGGPSSSSGAGAPPAVAGLKGSSATRAPVEKCFVARA